MTDITQRLRERQRVTSATSTGGGAYKQIITADPLCNEAADEIDAMRELLRLCRAERDELAAEVYRLRADIHSCHPNCTRAGCVNERLRAALRAMLTHMGMDEDEWNKPTFDQARAALGE